MVIFQQRWPTCQDIHQEQAALGGNLGHMYGEGRLCALLWVWPFELCQVSELAAREIANTLRSLGTAAEAHRNVPMWSRSSARSATQPHTAQEGGRRMTRRRSSRRNLNSELFLSASGQVDLPLCTAPSSAALCMALSLATWCLVQG